VATKKKRKPKVDKRTFVSIPQGEGHYDLVEVKKPKTRESYKSANAANKAARTKKPDAERCGLCGAMCTDPTEVSRHHEDTCSRHPDNAVHYQTGPDSCACGNLWPCTRMTGPGPKKPRTTVPLADKNGMPWEHTHDKKGSAHCMACIVERSAPHEGGILWKDFVGELITKLGFSPRYPGLTDEQHLRELIGPKWAEDAKAKWAVNWTVDGYLERRPHLKATKAELRRQHTCIMKTSSMDCRACNRGVPYPHMTIEETLASMGPRDGGGGDGVGAEHSPSPRWGVAVTKRGVVFNIDHQLFMLCDDYDPEDGWTKQAYYKWYAKQLTIAFKRLMDEP
jgi:hypothetical protein